MPARIARREFAKGVIDLAIRKALATLGRKPRKSFGHLLWNVQSRSDLLRPARYVGRVEAGGLDQIIQGLLALNEDRQSWLRPVKDWDPDGGTSIPMFSSLAHHLLADYPVPPVLLSAWFFGTDWFGRRRQRWFRHVGQGGSLRTAGFPIGLTRKMAHEFAHAPAQFSIDFALRWAQVRGLGGSDDLARTVASTRLGEDFSNEEFWTSVIHLFLNTPRVSPAEVEAIIDYLQDRKFVLERVVVGEETEIDLDPPEPDLSVKGRTVASLMRRVEQWRAERRADKPVRRLIRWSRSGVGEYRREGEAGLAWTIRELLDSDELAEEGKAMQHCVATYTDWCHKRQSTIWSLGAEGPEGRLRLVTVEVDPEKKRVVQASMKCNEEPDEPSMAILKDWAEREGLEVEEPDNPEP